MSEDLERPIVSAPNSPVPSSEEGINRISNEESRLNENLRMLLEAQNQNMMALINAIRPVSSRKVILPEFDPEKPDADARAWCTTTDLCLSEEDRHGSALILALTAALKGNASRWLSQISYAGITWRHFKEIFLSRYGTIETPAASLINLQNDKPRVDENMSSYAARLLTTLMARFKDSSSEEIILAVVLAHVSQFDGRLRRVAFTTEVQSREQMQRELQACSYMKRKTDNHLTDESKRSRAAVAPAPPRVTSNVDVWDIAGPTVAPWTPKGHVIVPTSSVSTLTKHRSNSPGVTCYRCNSIGHYASKCPRSPLPTARKNGSSNGAASDRIDSKTSENVSNGSQRHVDMCYISSPLDN